MITGVSMKKTTVSKIICTALVAVSVIFAAIVFADGENDDYVTVERDLVPSDPQTELNISNDTDILTELAEDSDSVSVNEGKFTENTVIAEPELAESTVENFIDTEPPVSDIYTTSFITEAITEVETEVITNITTENITTEAVTDEVLYFDSDIVYFTDTGTKYHRAGCSYLRSSSHKILLDEAVEEGYTPCSRCF